MSSDIDELIYTTFLDVFESAQTADPAAPRKNLLALKEAVKKDPAVANDIKTPLIAEIDLSLANLEQIPKRRL